METRAQRLLRGEELYPGTLSRLPLGHVVYPDESEVPFYSRRQADALKVQKRCCLVHHQAHWRQILVVDLVSGIVTLYEPSTASPVLVEAAESLVGMLTTMAIPVLTKIRDPRHERVEHTGRYVSLMRVRHEDLHQWCLPKLVWDSDVRQTAWDIIADDDPVYV